MSAEHSLVCYRTSGFGSGRVLRGSLLRMWRPMPLAQGSSPAGQGARAGLGRPQAHQGDRSQQASRVRFAFKKGAKLYGSPAAGGRGERALGLAAAALQPGAPPPHLGAAAAAAAAAAASSHPAGAAASGAAQLAYDMEDVGDLLVGHTSEFVRRSLQAVHKVERWEHGLQKQAAALPVGVRRLLAGGLAGAIGKTSTAPLETIKMQLVQNGGMGVWEAAVVLWQRAGFLAFWRGNAVDVLRTIPSRSLELSSYEHYKRVFRRWNRKHNDELHVPDKLVGGLAGGLAGVTASMLVYPLETARTRLAVGSAHGNFVSAIAGIAGSEGVGALYKGLDASLVGVVPYAAIRLGSYDGMKAVWRRSTGRKDIDPQAALLFGALAGVLSASATYPLEVTRRRMMAGAAFPNMAAALAGIVRQEGAGALFNGLLLSLLKQAPQAAITFSTYEAAKQFLEL